MEQRLHLAEALTRLETPQKVVLVQVIADVGIRQVQAFAAIGQVVHHQDIGDAPGIEGLHDVAADEVGTAGEDDHAFFSGEAVRMWWAQSSRLVK